MLTVSCQTATTTNYSDKLIPDSQYYAVIEKQTQNYKAYDGFANILDISATLLNSEATASQVDHNARIYQYNETQYTNEKATIQSNLAKHTEVFLSFFTPEKKHDDLARNATKWKIFLDIAGQRYEPKIVKIKSLLTEVQGLYPSHSRWGTAYKLTFPVSTTIVENGTAKLTFTGPVASISLDFIPTVKVK